MDDFRIISKDGEPYLRNMSKQPATRELFDEPVTKTETVSVRVLYTDDSTVTVKYNNQKVRGLLSDFSYRPQNDDYVTVTIAKTENKLVISSADS